MARYDEDSLKRVEREPGLQRELDLLEEQLINLTDSIRSLEDQLGPIIEQASMKNPGDSEKANDAREEAPLVMRVKQLQATTGHAQLLVGRLRGSVCL